MRLTLKEVTCVWKEDLKSPIKVNKISYPSARCNTVCGRGLPLSVFAIITASTPAD
jgi:hypothetical protein